jgi:hypothetical protein
MDEFNNFREKNGLQRYWEDVYMIKPAKQYANYLQPDEAFQMDVDDSLLTGFVNSDFGPEKKFEHILVRYIFENNMRIDMEQMYNIAEEISNMIIEADEEKAKLLNPEYNTVSIGLTWSDRQLVIICILTENLAGFKLIRATDKGIDVEGEIAQADWGVVAAKLVY